jgi:hypothetical protein
MPRVSEYKEQVCGWDDPDLGPPPPGVMFVFLKDGNPHMVDFQCPCGCGRSCQTYLTDGGLQPEGRRWTYSKGPNGPTIAPSMSYHSGCGSHFTITNGKVIWSQPNRV